MRSIKPIDPTLERHALEVRAEEDERKVSHSLDWP